jgi:hypothetical protein
VAISRSPSLRSCTNKGRCFGSNRPPSFRHCRRTEVTSALLGRWGAPARAGKIDTFPDSVLAPANVRPRVLVASTSFGIAVPSTLRVRVVRASSIRGRPKTVALIGKPSTFKTTCLSAIRSRGRVQHHRDVIVPRSVRLPPVSSCFQLRRGVGDHAVPFSAARSSQAGHDRHKHCRAPWIGHLFTPTVQSPKTTQGYAIFLSMRFSTELYHPFSRGYGRDRSRWTWHQELQ